jgi:zinc transport system substrate-binding protein
MKMLQVLFCWLMMMGAAWADAPTVVVSILPLYHIAQAVMGKAGTPVLLVPPESSEHSYSLKPSQYAALKNADVVIWISPEMETFLVDAMAQVPPAKQMVLINEPTLIRYNLRISGGTLPQKDPHLWLDPLNAMTVAKQLEKRLSALDPEHERLYQHNVDAFIDKISTLNTDLDNRLSPIQSMPYLVYHDAFQYFEKSSGLRRLDSISARPDVPNSAARWVEMSRLLKFEKIHCIFSEPQYQTGQLKQFALENHVELGTLDPIGTEKPSGTEGYAALLNGIADGLIGCLNRPVLRIEVK